MTAPDTKAIRAMADALEAETGRILLPGDRSVEAEAMRTLCDALDTAQTENERLREALKPFAEANKYFDSSFDDDYTPRWAKFFIIGDFRRALRAQEGDGK